MISLYDYDVTAWIRVDFKLNLDSEAQERPGHVFSMTACQNPRWNRADHPRMIKQRFAIEKNRLANLKDTIVALVKPEEQSLKSSARLMSWQHMAAYNTSVLLHCNSNDCMEIGICSHMLTFFMVFRFSKSTAARAFESHLFCLVLCRWFRSSKDNHISYTRA